MTNQQNALRKTAVSIFSQAVQADQREGPYSAEALTQAWRDILDNLRAAAREARAVQMPEPILQWPNTKNLMEEILTDLTLEALRNDREPHPKNPDPQPMLDEATARQLAPDLDRAIREHAPPLSLPDAIQEQLQDLETEWATKAFRELPQDQQQTLRNHTKTAVHQWRQNHRTQPD